MLILYCTPLISNCQLQSKLPLQYQKCIFFKFFFTTGDLTKFKGTVKLIFGNIKVIRRFSCSQLFMTLLLISIIQHNKSSVKCYLSIKRCIYSVFIGWDEWNLINFQILLKVYGFCSALKTYLTLKSHFKESDRFSYF